MSTKTTIKRIALVAVASMGFGVLATVPATAVENANPFTSSSTLSTSSLTVVAAGATSSYMGKFYVDLGANGTLTHSLVGLFSDESITVTTTAAPATTSVTTADLTYQALGSEGTAAVGNADASGSIQIPNAGGVAYTAYDSNNNTYNASYTTGAANRYWFGVYGNNARVLDAGEFTVRVRVINGDNTGVFFIDKTLKVKFVSVIGNAGATIALAQSGNYYVNQVLGYTDNDYMTATIADANGGRVQLGKAAGGTLASMAPVLNARTVTSAGVVTDTMTIEDSGTDAVDHVAPTATASYAAGVARQKAGDGVYGISGTITAAASVSTVIRVRITDTSTEKTATMTILGATTARDIYTDLRLTAAGMALGESDTKLNVESETTYTLPTTTTSATLRINANSTAGSGTTSGTSVANVQLTTTATWSGNYASADVTPATQTTGTTAYTDASGNIDLAITNAAPVAGGSLSIDIKGFATGAGTVGRGGRTVTINWAAPAVTTVTVSDPVASIKVLTKSTNVMTVGVADQFGNPMAGEKLQPSLGSTDANYSATKSYAVITTGANGNATFSLTDAAAVGADSDTVTFTSVTNSAKSGSYTLSYVTALPVVATLQMFYDTDATATAASLVPSTGIYSSGTTKLILSNARNTSKTLAAAGATTTDDMVAYRVRVLTSAGASATGAAVTVKSSTGGWLLDADGLPTMSRIFAVPSSGYVGFVGLATAPGAITFTVTAGTVTASASQWVAIPTVAAARTIAISGPATGSSNGDALTFTVTAKDRYGNLVADVPLTITATGVASFAGGATMQSFTTNDSGTYTFLGTSSVAAGGTGGFTATAGSTATDTASSKGYVSTTAVDSTLAAGVASASAAVTFAAGDSATLLAAQAANDAAAEATDAANAATDAANASAEAADAATAAAQDAADAVAALSAQVATLISGLKAQLTALTNLVIKIQKKVKA